MTQRKSGADSGGALEEPFYVAVLRKKHKIAVPAKPEPKTKRTLKGRSVPALKKPAHATQRGAVICAEIPIDNASGTKGFKSVFPPLTEEASSLIAAFGTLLRGVFPLKPQQQSSLPDRVRKLSHLLTDTRSERPAGYMNNPAYLSAYAYYFLWWNIIRLSRLFTGLNPAQNLPESFAAVDFGSGPLAAVCALWIACPYLRKKKIRWYCIDISREALAAGEKIYLRLAAKTGGEPWKIIRIKGSLDTVIKEKAALVVSANVFNEIMYMCGSSESKSRRVAAKKPFAAKNAFEALSAFAAPKCEMIVAEPGNPDGGAFITRIRKVALAAGFAPLSPCPHTERCPFPGSRREKWCHFAFDAESAPEKLIRLSKSAGLPKERAVLSFIYLVKNGEEPLKKDFKSEERIIPARVLSEKIRLPERKSGHYCCSELGMLLLSGKEERAKSANLASGEFLELRLKCVPPPDAERDPVTGALVVNFAQKPEESQSGRRHQRSPRAARHLQGSQDSAGQRRNVSRAVSGRHSSRAGKAR